MTLCAGLAALLVMMENWNPVDRDNIIARYCPVCADAASTKILRVAREFEFGLATFGPNVNTPGRVCIVTGRGMIDGAAKVEIAVTNAPVSSTTARIGFIRLC